MARIKLKIDFVAAINDLTTDKNKRIAYKKVMANDDAKTDFAKRLIDTMIDRTLSGKDKDGDSFAKYSKAYKKSLAFEVYDKTSTVTLKLTGAMQAAIRVTDFNSRSVEIGITDSEEANKAEGHITGANFLPVRDFWGFSKAEKETVLKETIKSFADTTDFGVVNEAVAGLDLSTSNNNGSDFDIEVEDL